MSKITVYSTTTCPYCRMLVEWLDKRGAEYTEYKVDLNPVAAQNMVRISGQMGVPFTTVESDNGKTEAVLGFDVNKLSQILGQA